MSTHSKAAFIKWVRVNHPQLYQDAMKRAGGELGAIADSISKAFNSLTETIGSAATAYVQSKSAVALIKANIKRAKAGLAPVNSLDEAGMYPTTGAGQTFGGIPQWMLFAGIGLIAFMLLRR